MKYAPVSHSEPLNAGYAPVSYTHLSLPYLTKAMIVTTDNKIMITTYVISCFVIVSPPFGDEPNSRQLTLLGTV